MLVDQRCRRPLALSGINHLASAEIQIAVSRISYQIRIPFTRRSPHFDVLRLADVEQATSRSKLRLPDGVHAVNARVVGHTCHAERPIAVEFKKMAHLRLRDGGRHRRPPVRLAKVRWQARIGHTYLTGHGKVVQLAKAEMRITRCHCCEARVRPVPATSCPECPANALRARQAVAAFHASGLIMLIGAPPAKAFT